MNSMPDPATAVKITEWHGLVPKRLLKANKVGEDKLQSALNDLDNDPEVKGVNDEDLVEAIVTIANDGVVLKAVENPFIRKDRSFVAYSHDKVPNSFWGRGVSEKGYNPQKALDAELRARIDALGLSTHPMMAMDAAMAPRGSESVVVRPGRTILTHGKPSDSLMPLQFPSPDTQTYKQTGDLERMIQMGTGAMDSATPTGISQRNNTASGMSMILAGAIKRTKRTMQNIERQFLDPFVTKAAWRFMQFDPNRYPQTDWKFKVHGTMGIMAREFEQQQLSNLLNTVPPDSPAYWLLLTALMDNSSLNNKEEIVQLTAQMLESALNPQPPPPDPMIEVKMRDIEVNAALRNKDIEKEARIELVKAAQVERELDLKQAELELDAAKFKTDLHELEVKDYVAQTDRFVKATAGILNIAKAEAEEVGTQIGEYKSVMEELNQKQKSVLEGDNKQDLQAVLNRLDGVEKSLRKQPRIKEIVREIKGSVAPQPALPPTNGGGQQPQQDLTGLDGRITALEQGGGDKGNLDIARDANGLVNSVSGRTVRRDENGLIVGLEENV